MKQSSQVRTSKHLRDNVVHRLRCPFTSPAFSLPFKSLVSSLKIKMFYRWCNFLSLSERVSAAKMEVETSPYQREISYNKLLPYGDCLDSEASQVLIELKLNLGHAVAFRELSPGGLHWSNRLFRLVISLSLTIDFSILSFLTLHTANWRNEFGITKLTFSFWVYFVIKEQKLFLRTHVFFSRYAL